MYPIHFGPEKTARRIRRLMENDFHAEAFIASIFLIERLLRRTLRQLIISAGFKSKIADKLIRRASGLNGIQEAWEIYDPQHRKLKDILGNEAVKTINEAGEKRNQLVHGQRVFKPGDYETEVNKLLDVLQVITDTFEKHYGYNGWEKARRRNKSVLHTDPKVKKS
ncbi:MAG: hypothetical protein KatS3mg033_1530 [Thermonema sp.]|uniref:hypothetical protein n=1 Tax=Thermonema sp. TaxID=2231181 RepID=UPI0021DE6EF5|nr:hypothetical protein [Thermonema sp.]GIV39730.1 MAG: hypothetical protein KatS3mg033_1530 [Thermonema sp.]